MLIFLYRLFVIGFPPKCKHEFGKWRIVSVQSNNYGTIKAHQSRECALCGFHEFTVDTNG